MFFLNFSFHILLINNYLQVQRPCHVTTNYRTYLLAQAHVDASALSNSISNLNTSTTFSPLQPLQDTDVAGYLRIAHEQNPISTMEEGWRETQEEVYRVLEERGHEGICDW